MSDQEYLNEIIRYWKEKAEESLESASDEMKAGRLSFSVNRLYYACFYIVSALLFQENYRFKKHSGVRAAFHKHFVKSGQMSYEHGKLYDELFEARQRGDYIELVNFEKKLVEEWLTQTKQFTDAVRSLIKT